MSLTRLHVVETTVVVQSLAPALETTVAFLLMDTFLLRIQLQGLGLHTELRICTTGGE